MEVLGVFEVTTELPQGHWKLKDTSSRQTLEKKRFILKRDPTQ